MPSPSPLRASHPAPINPLLLLHPRRRREDDVRPIVGPGSIKPIFSLRLANARRNNDPLVVNKVYNEKRNGVYRRDPQSHPASSLAVAHPLLVVYDSRIFPDCITQPFQNLPFFNTAIGILVRELNSTIGIIPRDFSLITSNFTTCCCCYCTFSRDGYNKHIQGGVCSSHPDGFEIPVREETHEEIPRPKGRTYPNGYKLPAQTPDMLDTPLFTVLFVILSALIQLMPLTWIPPPGSAKTSDRETLQSDISQLNILSPVFFLDFETFIAADSSWTYLPSIIRLLLNKNIQDSPCVFEVKESTSSLLHGVSSEMNLANALWWMLLTFRVFLENRLSISLELNNWAEKASFAFMVRLLLLFFVNNSVSLTDIIVEDISSAGIEEPLSQDGVKKEEDGEDVGLPLTLAGSKVSQGSQTSYCFGENTHLVLGEMQLLRAISRMDGLRKDEVDTVLTRWTTVVE
ncbi:hypothetical protein B0H19DRAFT_1253738 [Mycena capillaripes]|nr:hypothetical protein B0H19DRAFT_1253738 [Mycena capillaripes]